MSAIVVENEMHFKTRGHRGVNLIEELAKLKRAMTAMQLTNDFPRLSVQCGKQRSGAVTFVIVRPTLGLSRTHGQNRLRAIQGLDLRFLIHTQHQRFIRRIQVKPYHVADLIDKQRVFRKLEGLSAMRRQSESLPHAMN